MALTIELVRTASDQAQARVGEQVLGTFEPQALLVDQPLLANYPVPADAIAYGQRLLAALGGATLQALIRQQPMAPDLTGLILLRTADVDLASIPWEYLHTGEYQDSFVILDYLLVREVPGAPLPAPPADTARPWRLVVQGSDPLLMPVQDETGKVADVTKLPRLRVVRELDALRDSLVRQNRPLRWQRIAPTRQALIHLASNEPVLFHYTGHGDVVNEQAVLCFDDGTGLMDPQPLRDLARQLRGRVYFAFLNACRTADVREPGANLAVALVRGGVPVVLGMQYQMLDDAAAPFARTFYEHLSAGEHPAQSLWHARLSLQNEFRNRPMLWGIPVLHQADGYQWPQQAPREVPRPVPEPEVDTLALQAPDQLLGREVELVELARLYVKDDVQVVTIRGAGGMGKTTLAHGLARRLRFHFPDGIFALTLALAGGSRLSATEVRRQLAALLGVRDTQFDEATEDAQERFLVAVTQGRQVLLIFDNYETVLGKLGRDLAEEERVALDAEERAEADAMQRLVLRLANAGVRLLFTSRRNPVGVPGEQLYPSDAQGPQLEGLDVESSVELFRQHGGRRSHSAEFPGLVAEAVGYSPLAIRLAAPRWDQGQQTEAEFLQRIHEEVLLAEQDGVPEHQRSAVANVRLSIDVLPPALRRDFLALSIIANPLIMPIHGAVVWGLEDEEQWFTEQAHAQLERLMDYSLLLGIGYDEAHNRALAYQIQPVIAQVMRRVVDEGQLEEAYQRYATWAAQLVDRGYGKDGVDFDVAFAQYMQTILGDVIAAVPHLPQPERGWVAWRAAVSVRRFGLPLEALHLLQLAEESARAEDDQSLLSRVHVERANIKEAQGDLSEALLLYEEALGILEQLGDLGGKAATLAQMAGVLVTRGDLDGAMRLYEEALALKEQLGDVRGKAATLHQMAIVLARRGDLNGAMRLYEESLALKEQLGDVRGKAATLAQMAGVLVTRGDLDGAMRLYEEALGILEQVGDVGGKAATLHQMAIVLVRRGDLDGAMRLYEESLALKEQLGDVQGKAATLANMAGVLVMHGELDSAMRLLEEAQRILEQLGDVGGKAATLHQMAGVLVTRGDLDGAMRLYEESLVLKEQLGDVRGKAATLANMAQLEFRRGRRDEGLRKAQESLHLLEGMGAGPEAAQVREILAAMEGASAEPDFTQFTPVRQMGALVALTTRALRREIDLGAVRAQLESLQDSTLAELGAYIAALKTVLDGTEGAAARLLDVAEPLLQQGQGTIAERADAYAGIANIARELEDETTELAARQAAVQAWRTAGDEREVLVSLSFQLYNLAMYHQRQDDFGAAVLLLEEVVALDERTGHEDLEADRAALEAARRRALGERESLAQPAIAGWLAGPRDEETLAPLLNLLCNAVVEVLRDGDEGAQQTLSEELEMLREARPLPIAGAFDFLGILQDWLRPEPGRAEEVARQRAALPIALASVLQRMEQLLQAADESMATEAGPSGAAGAMAVMAQVAPIFQQVAQVLADPQVSIGQQSEVAQQVEQWANQAASGEMAGSPWLEAAAALRALMALLQGQEPQWNTLTPMYRALIEQVRTTEG